MTRFFPAALLALVLACGQVACQTAPTKVTEVPARKLEGVEKLLAPVKVTAETILIDARPQFEYSVAHIPGSVNLQWTDFTEPERSQRGILQGDLFGVARRLARFGIAPNAHVVVMGQGFDGSGEEGRIAWMLAYLGVSNVQFTDIDTLKARFTNAMEENYPKTAPIWKPEPAESLNVTRGELLSVINKKGVHQPTSTRSGQPPMLYKIIDVRTARAYLGRDSEKSVPNMDAVNIPWQEFFEPTMRVQAGMRARLEGVGILPQHRIIVLDEDGVSSAAVTMALRALGYERAGNYAGGLTDLMSGVPARK